MISNITKDMFGREFVYCVEEFDECTDCMREISANNMIMVAEEDRIICPECFQYYFQCGECKIDYPEHEHSMEEEFNGKEIIFLCNYCYEKRN